MTDAADSTPDAAPRPALQVSDLERLASALAATGRPPAIYQALEALSSRVIGHRLFTIMRFDADRGEVERVHTSLPSVYPVGGRKAKARTAWSDHVLRDQKIFVAADPDGIRAAFDDHNTILGLGLGSIINVPIVFEGRCLGTMNLCHQAGWYGTADEPIGRLLASFLVPPLLKVTHGG
jgi:hypothetical protein